MLVRAGNLEFALFGGRYPDSVDDYSIHGGYLIGDVRNDVVVCKESSSIEHGMVEELHRLSSRSAPFLSVAQVCRLASTSGNQYRQLAPMLVNAEDLEFACYLNVDDETKDYARRNLTDYIQEKHDDVVDTHKIQGRKCLSRRHDGQRGRRHCERSLDCVSDSDDTMDRNARIEALLADPGVNPSDLTALFNDGIACRAQSRHESRRRHGQQVERRPFEDRQTQPRRHHERRLSFETK